MIISHKYECVFVHIPKNGGTFVTNFIKSIDPSCEDYHHNLGYCETGHQTMDFIINNYENYDEIKEYTFFAVVRSPIEKLLSSFNYYWHSYFKFNSFLNQLDFCNSQNLHISNLSFLSSSSSLSQDIVLLDFDNLSKDLICFFIYQSVSDIDLLDVLSNVNLDKVNVSSKKLVKELKKSDYKVLGLHPFMNEELSFWHKFREFKRKNAQLPLYENI